MQNGPLCELWARCVIPLSVKKEDNMDLANPRNKKRRTIEDWPSHIQLKNVSAILHETNESARTGSQTTYHKPYVAD